MCAAGWESKFHGLIFTNEAPRVWLCPPAVSMTTTYKVLCVCLCVCCCWLVAAHLSDCCVRSFSASGRIRGRLMSWVSPPLSSCPRAAEGTWCPSAGSCCFINNCNLLTHTPLCSDLSRPWCVFEFVSDLPTVYNNNNYSLFIQHL